MLRFIRRELPVAEVKFETSTTVAFRTPFNTDHKRIVSVLEQLESRRETYGIGGFGMAQNSLRDNYGRYLLQLIRTCLTDDSSVLTWKFYTIHLKFRRNRESSLRTRSHIPAIRDFSPGPSRPLACGSCEAWMTWNYSMEKYQGIFLSHKLLRIFDSHIFIHFLEWCPNWNSDLQLTFP